MGNLTREEQKRFAASPVKCHRVTGRIASLGDYLSILSSTLSDSDRFWFRGHMDVRWELIPSALRYDELARRNAALGLLPEFRRVAEMKLERPPRPEENLKWLQLAQHYGIPTRLLDWTESATFALYFACRLSSRGESDGMVFLLNPLNLPMPARRAGRSSLDSDSERGTIERYLRLDGKERPRGRLRTVAITPIWNSERLMLQRGVFTLHGAQRFDLDGAQAPSLVGIPVLREVKARLRRELARSGVDEMTIFPELEHACRQLKRVWLREES